MITITPVPMITAALVNNGLDVAGALAVTAGLGVLLALPWGLRILRAVAGMAKH